MPLITILLNVKQNVKNSGQNVPVSRLFGMVIMQDIVISEMVLLQLKMSIMVIQEIAMKQYMNQMNFALMLN